MPISSSTPSNKKKNTIFFDLDGTLIDHFTTIYKSVVHAQRQLGLTESTYEVVRATVGGSVPVTLERLLGKEHVENGLVHFNECFNSIMFDDVFSLSGAEWILRNLKERGYKLAVFTNKSADHSRKTLAHLKLDQWLDSIIGTGETPFRKPQPEFTRLALDKLSTTPENSILIGDSPFDYQTAAAFEIDCYLLSTGTHSEQELSEETEAKAIFSDLYQLGAAVFDLKR